MEEDAERKSPILAQLEKTDDLWNEVTGGQNKLRMEREAIRIAATVLRFINDVC